jgi:hypothetical protein
MKLLSIYIVCLAAFAQEANSGLELLGNLSGIAAYSHKLSQDPRDGSPLTGGVRLMEYPTLKLTDHWSVSGAFQLSSRPYFYEQFETQGYGIKGDLLQAYLTYARVRKNRSIVIRAGQLSAAFGSFLLRYDDTVNPLIDSPYSYGYYEKGITKYGLPGAEIDATAGKLDIRTQFANSSPANRRSIFDREQYGTWIAGAGYTIAQGFRIGASVYRGPYLDRKSEFFFPGESDPKKLPATAVGIDVQWGRGPWNAQGELHRFVFPYHAIPTFKQNTGYAELKRTLSPRWYVAARLSYVRMNLAPPLQVFEMAAGYRPNRFQLVKLGYQAMQGQEIRGSLSNTLAVQLVTSLPSISLAR